MRRKEENARKTYQGRYCKHFFCERIQQNRCCADCWIGRTGNCIEEQGPCLNEPSRCGLEDVEELERVKEARKEIARERKRKLEHLRN